MRRAILTTVLVALAGGCQWIAGLQDRQVADAADPSCSWDAGVSCPDDTAFVPTMCVCIDRYEASQIDAGLAGSVAGAMPWTGVTWDAAGAACTSVGKRLCSSIEWEAACSGPSSLPFPYGDTYVPDRCNGGDLLNDAGVTELWPTGRMTGCEGGYPGVFDMSGNIWEWISDQDPRGPHTKGGAFNAMPYVLPTCSSQARWGTSYATTDIGFRCCRRP